MRIIFVVMVLGVAACSPGRHPARPATGTPAIISARPSPEGAHSVTFAIRGTVPRASVTYTTPDGRKRRDVVSPPWSRTFAVNNGQGIDVTARSTEDGTLGCTLTVDGEVLRSATSSGDSATVDCGFDF